MTPGSSDKRLIVPGDVVMVVLGEVAVLPRLSWTVTVPVQAPDGVGTLPFHALEDVALTDHDPDPLHGAFQL